MARHEDIMEALKGIDKEINHGGPLKAFVEDIDEGDLDSYVEDPVQCVGEVLNIIGDRIICKGTRCHLDSQPHRHSET